MSSPSIIHYHQRITCRLCGRKKLEITTQEIEGNTYVHKSCTSCKFVNINLVSLEPRNQKNNNNKNKKRMKLQKCVKCDKVIEVVDKAKRPWCLSCIREFYVTAASIR